MSRIHEWYIKSYYNGVYAIKGVAEIGGSSQRIRTEPVSAVLYDRGRKLLLVTVEGGQMYTLNTDDMYIGRRCYPPKDWVDEIHSEREIAVRNFCYDFGFPELAETIIDAKNEKIRLLEEKIERIKQMIPENTVYLALRDNGYYFHYGVYNMEGQIGNCEMYCHSGMFQDSILVYGGEGIDRQTLVRFFPLERSSVEFYRSMLQMCADVERPAEGTLLGYLYNSGTGPLNVQFTWGRHILLQPDEEIEVRYGMGDRGNIPVIEERLEKTRKEFHELTKGNDITQ